MSPGYCYAVTKETSGELRKCCPVEQTGNTRVNEMIVALLNVCYMSGTVQGILHILSHFLKPCIENFQTYKSRIIHWNPMYPLPIFNNYWLMASLVLSVPLFISPMHKIFWNKSQKNTISSIRFQYALYRFHFSLSFFFLQFMCWGSLVICSVKFPTIWICWLIPVGVI